MDHHPPLIAPIDPSRIRIDMPDYADADDTDGNHTISWMAVAFLTVVIIALVALWWVMA